ncbi:hypothetical protein ACHAQJ_010651 [Trichoderma viride]
MNYEKNLYENQSQSRLQSFRASNQSSSNTQFALAGLSGSDKDPRVSVKQFPHQRLDSEEREGKKSGSESGQQRSRLRDDDRKGHLDVMLRATEQFLAQGNIAKAAKAFGIILQLRPRTQSIDIRLHHLWSIGAEVLMRQREKLQEIHQRILEQSASGQSGDDFRKAESRWDSSSNMSEIKSYFEILIRQYAYDHKLPHKISAVDFWLALLSCELSNIYAEHLGAIARLEDEKRLQRTDSARQDLIMPISPNTSDSGGDPGLRYEHWVKSQKEAIYQRTLIGLRDINLRMEKLMDQLPYSKNAHFLQLREMTSRLSIDLTSPPPSISGL